MPVTARKNIQKDVLGLDIARFAMIFHAYSGCSPEIQAIVHEMTEIVVDESVSEEDRLHAIDVVLEALFPALASDFREEDDRLMNSEAAQQARTALDDEEAQFAERLRALMAERGITQEVLAEMTGVSQPAISNILNRRCRPQQRTIARLAAALQVESHELWPPHQAG